MSEVPATLTFVEPSARGFLDALHNALLFATTDVTLPALRRVHFEWEPSEGLTLVATDRYTLSHQTVKAATGNPPPEPFQFDLDLDSAKALLSTHRTAKHLWLVVNEEIVRVQGDVTTEHKIATGEFVKWRSILPSTTPGPAVDTISFNPRLLARFGKVKQPSKYSPVALKVHGPTAPAVAEFSDGPTVVIMPVRVD